MKAIHLKLVTISTALLLPLLVTVPIALAQDGEEEQCEQEKKCECPLEDGETEVLGSGETASACADLSCKAENVGQNGKTECERNTCFVEKAPGVAKLISFEHYMELLTQSAGNNIVLSDFSGPKVKSCECITLDPKCKCSKDLATLQAEAGPNCQSKDIYVPAGGTPVCIGNFTANNYSTKCDTERSASCGEKYCNLVRNDGTLVGAIFIRDNSTTLGERVKCADE